jgi:large subunit ribosomal protein L28
MFLMAKVCQITGKKPNTGNKVSHSVRRIGRWFFPNLHKKRFFDPETGRWVKVRITTSAMRTLAKPLSRHEAKKIERKAAQKEKY